MAMIKASSIYESVLSIAIISITITVATSIFVNIMNSQHNISYFQMIEKVTELKNECIEKQLFSNKNIKYKNYTIEQIITNYKDQENLKLVNFNVKKEMKKIRDFNFLIRKK